MLCSWLVSPALYLAGVTCLYLACVPYVTFLVSSTLYLGPLMCAWLVTSALYLAGIL
jgi:hypothetical protein